MYVYVYEADATKKDTARDAGLFSKTEECLQWL